MVAGWGYVIDTLPLALTTLHVGKEGGGIWRRRGGTSCRGSEVVRDSQTQHDRQHEVWRDASRDREGDSQSAKERQRLVGRLQV